VAVSQQDGGIMRHLPLQLEGCGKGGQASRGLLEECMQGAGLGEEAEKVRESGSQASIQRAVKNYVLDCMHLYAHLTYLATLYPVLNILSLDQVVPGHGDSCPWRGKSDFLGTCC
jgi:hypothetical protein